MQPFKIIRLATRDYAHEWRMSSCFILALAAVLGPMLVLFGLKFGIVGGMFQQLVENPDNREIRPAGSGSYQPQWIDNLRQRSDVAFILPRTRSLASTIQLKSVTLPRILKTEIIPSGTGDPLLKNSQIPDGFNQIVLSHSAANKLKVDVGDNINGSLQRRYRGQKERVHLTLQVVGIAPASAFPRDGAFADLRLVEAFEDFRDGHEVRPLGWIGAPQPPQRTYPGFRLYVKSIYDVAGLKKALNDAGIEVRTRAAEIELVMKIDRNLSAIYWVIAIIGLAGFALSLGASLWANVDRKRKEFSILRLVGFRTGDIIWFPMIQAFYTATFGSLLAIGIYTGVAWAINDMLGAQLADGEKICVLLPEHYFYAVLLTVGASLFSAILAGMRCARIEPSEGLREI
jgi:putative ABC transport system permease protein